MSNYKFIYGPVPSRRLGQSLGVSPILKKTCNYSCIYCQLGRTDKMVNERKPFIKTEEIISELKAYLKKSSAFFDVITIDLGNLISEIKKLTTKPIAVITNGSLLFDEIARKDLMLADIVMPSIDAFDEQLFKKINRPYGSLLFKNVYNGIIEFSHEFKGAIWLEIMLVEGYNDSKTDILNFKKILSKINYDKLYINTPARPPAEKYAKMVDAKTLEYAVQTLGGVSIENLVSVGFYSEIENDFEAVLSIIKRHPMNQHEIKSFLESRKCNDIENVFNKLNINTLIEKINYKNYITYRLK